MGGPPEKRSDHDYGETKGQDQDTGSQRSGRKDKQEPGNGPDVIGALNAMMQGANRSLTLLQIWWR